MSRIRLVVLYPVLFTFSSGRCQICCQIQLFREYR
jgi:hypothetical protein